MWSAALARQSAGCLLAVALKAAFASASPILETISALGDVCGPLLSALIFGGVLRFQLPYPMDAAFLFSMSACFGSALYLGSLMLHLQFRGDFGVMPDEASSETGTNRSGTNRSGTNGLAYLLRVSFGDLSLLLGPLGGGSVYGTRIFQLRKTGDLKVV